MFHCSRVDFTKYKLNVDLNDDLLRDKWTPVYCASLFQG